MIAGLVKLISSLGEPEFKYFITEYLKVKFDTTEVRIVDGPYDGGNDAEIIKDGKDTKRNIQITIIDDDNKFVSKLEEDLIKAQTNVVKYTYVNVLDFYIRKRVSKEKRNKLELDAELNHKIRLSIYDGNILAHAIKDIESLKLLVYKLHNIPYSNPSNHIDKQSKMLFDCLTLNKNNVEIKKHFIHSFIFSFIYSGFPDNTGRREEEIIDHTKSQLPDISAQYITKILNQLRMRQELISPSADKKIYYLSDEKKDEIGQLYEIVSEQETELNDMIETFICDNNIHCKADDLVNNILKLYNDNYTIDADEILSATSSYSNSIKRTYNDLVKLLETHSCNNANDEAIKLLDICGKNPYLNKIASSQLFLNLSSSDKLESYINQKQQQVFLDTQILLRLVCVFYQSMDYSDIAMQSTKVLWDTISDRKYNVGIFSSYDYVDEVAGHFVEAYQLCRFMTAQTLITNIQSKNVFFNTFNELHNNNYLEVNINSFFDYLCDIAGFDISEYTLDNLLNEVKECFDRIFESYGVTLINHQNYANFNSVRTDYENSLSYLGKNRSYTARENDLRTILYLSSNLLAEPYLITWDTAFYEFRKNLNKKHNLAHWYIYTPSKIVDRLSVMKFQVNPEAITLNIISMVEDNFNYSSRTHTFLDTISRFFNDKDVTKYKIIQKLNELDRDTKSVEDVDISTEYQHEESNRTTLLLLDIINHYSSDESEYSFDCVINVFQNQTMADDILNIFKADNNIMRSEIYNKIDELIKSEKE